jgi:hypothetical protein
MEDNSRRLPAVLLCKPSSNLSTIPEDEMMQITRDYSVFMNQSYYDLMNWIQKSSEESDGKEKINVTVFQINGNRKFVKFIKSPHFLYIALQTSDREICERLDEINRTHPEEGPRRHATADYFLECISNVEKCKKLFVNSVIYR